MVVYRLQEVTMGMAAVAFMNRWFDEVWNKGNADAIDEMMAEDAIIHGLGESDKDVRGPASFKPFQARLRAAFPDIQVTVEDTIEEGDLMASRWTATMTHQGDDLGVPSTGQRVTISGMSIARLKDGMMVEGWNNWDQMAMMQQIGAFQPAATLVAD